MEGLGLLLDDKFSRDMVKSIWPLGEKEIELKRGKPAKSDKSRFFIDIPSAML